MSKMSHGVAATGLRQGMARVAAVMIVPLMASIDIHASSVLPITNFSCTTSTDGGVPVSCPAGAGVSQLSDPGNGIQGLKFFTGGAVDYLASTAANLRFNASGRLIGTIDAGTVIPVSYDFTIEPEGSVDFWTLQYILLSGMIPFAEFDSSGRGTGTFQTSFDITVASTVSGGPVGVQTNLILRLTNAGSTPQPVSINVPSHSFDINSNSTTVPEPGSLGLLISGLVLLTRWLAMHKSS